jgi:hypothetical protein
MEGSKFQRQVILYDNGFVKGATVSIDIRVRKKKKKQKEKKKIEEGHHRK